jgi:hypothetical protein
MLVKDLPRCNNLVTDTAKPGNTACCNRVASWTITLASGVAHHACISCLVKRLAIVADDVDTATVAFLIKDKNAK